MALDMRAMMELAPNFCACAFALIFAAVARFGPAKRKAAKPGPLYVGLLQEEEGREDDDDAAPYVVPSSSPLACRQALCYVLVAWAWIAAAWAGRREVVCLRSVGRGLVGVTWLLVTRGDAASTRRIFFGANGKTFLRALPRYQVSRLLPVAASIAFVATVGEVSATYRVSADYRDRLAPAVGRGAWRSSTTRAVGDAAFVAYAALVAGACWHAFFRWPRARLSRAPPTAEERAITLGGIAFLTWLEPCLDTGTRRPLDLADLGELGSFDGTEEQWRRFAKILGRAEAPRAAGDAPRRLYRRLWRLIMPQLAPFSALILTQTALNYARIFAFKVVSVF